MLVPAAYLAVILIWTTTPLAIKWSGEEPGFLFGVTGRMVLGTFMALLAVRALRLRMPWHRRARNTYMAGGLGLYTAMMCVYWSAQFIPSGWISVLFGTTPMVTGVMAAIWLDDRVLTPWKLGGILLGIAGLMIIFATSLEMDSTAYLGIAGMLLATVFHSAGSVWVKRMGRGLHGLAVTAGSLMVAVPLFLLTWFLTDSGWPAHVSKRAAYSIVYLAVFGSVIGYALYFYVLKQMEATRVSLITLVTPVTALFLGNRLNHEPLEWRVWLGTVVILSGLLCFEFGGRRLIRPVARKTKVCESD